MDRGVSAVLGMMLILAVLASIVTVFVVYKLPAIEKKVEFQREGELINEFFKLAPFGSERSLCLGYSFLGRESSAFRVWECAREEVTVYYNNTTETLQGYLFGYNLSIYPSRLPEVRVVLTPIGAVIHQNGVRLNLSTNFSSIATPSAIYVDNYSVNGKKSFTISGNGIVFVSVSKTIRPVVKASKATVTIYSMFGKKSVTYTNVTVYYRNYSVLVS